MAVFHPMSGSRKRKGSRHVWVIAGVGAAMMAYALFAPTDGGIPGWQPVNGSLRATLAERQSDTPAATLPNAPRRASEPAASEVPPAETASAGSTERLPQAAPSDSALPGQLDLNKATAEELDGLPGIGPSKAKSIVAYREAHNGFRTVDELLQVKGIGPKLLDKIRPLVSATKPLPSPGP